MIITQNSYIINGEIDWDELCELSKKYPIESNHNIDEVYINKSGKLNIDGKSKSSLTIVNEINKEPMITSPSKWAFATKPFFNIKK